MLYFYLLLNFLFKRISFAALCPVKISLSGFSCSVVFIFLVVKG